ncbi:MAG TPA: sensor histidine kinase [Polyangia bacterium]|nr:sensor histidine kinase [Polyangia bacterium]
MRDEQGQLTLGSELPVDDVALDEHLRAVAFRHGRVAVLFLTVFVGALWPTDWYVFHGQHEVQHVVGALRLAIITTCGTCFALLNTSWGARKPNFILGLCGASILFAIGWFLGKLGNPDQPWDHLAYPALFFSVLAPVRLGHRFLLVGALTFALLTGFVWSFPLHFHAPMCGLLISFMVSLAFMVVAVGNLSFKVLRQSFYQSMALEGASHQLADANEQLEARVRAQTHDLRRLAQHLEHAREEERTRIARELHDELGQQLTALNLTLALTQQRVTEGPQRIRANLSELESLLKRTHATVRQLVTELRPLPFDQLGLPEAIEWLARQTEQRAQIRCKVVSEKLDGLSAAVSTAAFRVVQEALTNVARHARCKSVEIVAVVRDGQLMLSISDDGVGLPPLARPTGFGLIGIRERVANLSGRLELRERPGGGTTVAVSVPLAHAEAAG